MMESKEQTKKMTAGEFWTLSCTWGLFMTLLGAVAALALIVTGHKPKLFHYVVYFEVGEGWGGVNLGAFFIVNKNATEATKRHEAGHGVQNTMLGAVMPFLVSIPSAVRYWIREAKKKKGLGATLPPYDSVWFEAMATNLGEMYFSEVEK